MATSNNPEGSVMAGEEKDAVDPSTIFYATVGHGISGWASMEGWLVQVAAKLLGAIEEKTGLLL
jgi:hypothetical protein